MYELFAMENTWVDTAAEGIERVQNSYEIPKGMVSICAIFYMVCMYVCFCMYVCIERVRNSYEIPKGKSY